MGENSKIQWTNHTWNPWHGCIKVSEGCKFCYMYRDKERWKKDPTEIVRSKSDFNGPLRISNPALIFTCSWSDFFIEDADEWRKDAWEIIRKTPQHTYQILTKRPERIKHCLPPFWGDLKNVWLGVSVESPKHVERIDILANLPAPRELLRFVSFEPLIEPIRLGEVTNGAMIFYMDWVIIGGESGNENGKYKYRPCELKWIEDLIADCRHWGALMFVKQLGTHLAKKLKLKDRFGGDMEEWPEHLRIRQIPGRPATYYCKTALDLKS